jgi:hypothetical protein
MTASELVTCRVPEDPMFPHPTDGYVVTFVAFYEQGFSVSTFLFQHSHTQINEGVAEEVVSPKEQCLHAAPRVHRLPPPFPCLPGGRGWP